MFQSSRHLIDIPSLDRLIAYLENRDDRRLQLKIDAMEAQLRAARLLLTQSNQSLGDAVQENQQNAS